MPTLYDEFPPIFLPARVIDAVEFLANREQALIDIRSDVLEAERERGADEAVNELVRGLRQAKAICGDRDDARVLIATFCGSIQTAFPELAREFANAAGMTHLYAEGK